jgi:hypothetical protein
MKEILCKQGNRWVVHYRRPDDDPDINEAISLIKSGVASSYKVVEAGNQQQ